MQRLKNGGVRIEYRDFDNNEYAYKDITKIDIDKLANIGYGYIDIPNVNIKPSMNRSVERCFYIDEFPEYALICRDIIMRGVETKEEYLHIFT